jgi:hypothetical protein
VAFLAFKGILVLTLSGCFVEQNGVGYVETSMSIPHLDAFLYRVADGDRESKNYNLYELLWSMKPENYELAENLMVTVRFGLLPRDRDLRVSLPEDMPERVIMALWLCHVFARACPWAGFEVLPIDSWRPFKVEVTTKAVDGMQCRDDVSGFIWDYSGYVLGRVECFTDVALKVVRQDAIQACQRHYGLSQGWRGVGPKLFRKVPL